MDQIPQPDPDQLADLRRQLDEEHATESIRTQVLAMRSREDLTKVIGAVYQELLDLGIETPICSILFVNEDETTVMRYAALRNPTTYGITWTSKNLQALSPQIAVGRGEEQLEEDEEDKLVKWREGKIWTVAYPQEVIDGAMLGMQKLFGLSRPMDFGQRQWQSTYVPFPYGWVSTWHPADVELSSVVQRMTQTLSLGYLRFLDLQHLEDQNKTLKDALHQLQQTQSQLVLQEKMAALGRLVAGITHEINTPLGAITSMGDTQARSIDKLRQNLQNDGEATDPVLRRAFERIAQAQQVITTGTERIAAIVRTLKSFVHLDQAEFQKADLHQGLDTALALLDSQLEGRIQIHRDYAEIEPVYCAPSQLNQVFLALLENAVQAIEGPGQIEVKTAAGRSHTYIQITDNGRGIPEEEVETLFDFDFSSDGHRIKMGFGLPTAFNIVRDHNGELTVESKEGHGTKVTIRLPTDRDEPQAETT